MSSRVRCMKCGAESFNDGNTKLVCQKCYQALEALNTKKDEALKECSALFYEIRCDFIDPRSECREGMRIIEQALTLTVED